MTTTPQVNSFNNTFVPAMVVTDQTVVVEEADIAEVEMDEQPDDNDIDKMADKPESIPDTNVSAHQFGLIPVLIIPTMYIN